MIEISLLTGELILAGVWIAVRLILWLIRRHIDWRRELLLLLMYINLAVLLRFTFYPMQRVDGQVQPLVIDLSAVFSPKLNLIPFVNLLVYDTRRELLLNLIGNVTMFIPTGIILPILYRRLDRFWKVALAGFALSLCIELLQLPVGVRTSDVDDLILNTAGVMIGYGIYALVYWIIRKVKRGKQKA